MAPQRIGIGNLLRCTVGLVARRPRKMTVVLMALLMWTVLIAVLTGLKPMARNESDSRERLQPRLRESRTFAVHSSIPHIRNMQVTLQGALTRSNHVVDNTTTIIPPKNSTLSKQKDADIIDPVGRHLTMRQTSHALTDEQFATENKAYEPRAKVQPVARYLGKDMRLDLYHLLQDLLKRDFERNSSSAITSNQGTDKNGRCKRGYFRLSEMPTCHEWLQCDEITRLKTGKVYGTGVGKTVYSSSWHDYDIAVVIARKDRVKYQRFLDRVQAGVDNALQTQPGPYTTQVLGYCARGNNTILVMEGCKHGDLRWFMAGPTYFKLSKGDKLKMAIQIVAGFDYLHNGFKLPRIHCDLHSVAQAFGQYLVGDDLRIFLNDLDELPEVNRAENELPHCESEPMGQMGQPRFLAPEIRYTVREYEEGTQLKPVNEKADVWKIPDLTANIMAIDRIRQDPLPIDPGFRYYFERELRSIHERCKRLRPQSRPTSREVLTVYLEVYQAYLKAAEDLNGGNPPQK